MRLPISRREIQDKAGVSKVQCQLGVGHCPLGKPFNAQFLDVFFLSAYFASVGRFLLFRKQRLELFYIFFTMFSDGELRLPSESDVALLEKLKDGIESHFVAGVGSRLEEFARGNGVLSADSAYETQRRKKLIL